MRRQILIMDGRLWALLIALVHLGQVNGPLVASPPASPPATAVPGSPQTGLPFLRVFRPKEYRAETQDWAIVQDLRGVIYVANNSGVLEFDGVRWRLIPLANGTLARSLAVDASGRIYVGGVSELGTLEPDASGRMRYVSWLDRLPREERSFKNVSQTFSTKDGAVFASRTHIFQVAAAVKVWKTSTNFQFVAQVGERLFANELNRGLLELTGGSWKPVPGGDFFSVKRIRVMVPGWEEGTVLVGTESDGLFLLHADSLRPFSTEVDADLKRDLIYCGARLGGGDLALGTLQGGLYVLDSQGRLRSRLAKPEGLPDPSVLGLGLDRQGGLWMGTENGIARAEVGFPLTSFAEGSGLEGIVQAFHRHMGTLFAATTLGVYRLPPGGTRFLPVEGISSQSWAFLEDGADLLLANKAGVYSIQRALPVLVRPSRRNPFSMGASRRDPSRVFVALENGLASMRRDGDRWVDEGMLPVISEIVRTLCESADGRLWAGTQSNGILRVTFSPDWKGGDSPPQPTVERFGTAEGLPTLNWNGVHRIGGQLAFATQKGIYRFDEASRRFSPDPRFENLFPGGPRWVYGLEEDPRGWIWTHSYGDEGLQETGAAVPERGGTYRWEPRPLRHLAGLETLAIRSEADGVMWFGNESGVFRLDTKTPKAYDQPFRALVRNVTGTKGRLIFGGAGPGPAPTLSYAENALRFEYAALSFDGLEANRFQVLLEGLDKDWTAWSSEAYRDYTNIHEGRYRFRVRASVEVEAAAPTLAEDVADDLALQTAAPWLSMATGSNNSWSQLGFDAFQVGSSAAFQGFGMILGGSGGSIASILEPSDAPALIYRSGNASPSNFRLRPGETGLSFRSSLSNPLESRASPVFRPGGEYVVLDATRLPAGAVQFDTVPHGHVTVSPVPVDILKAAVVQKGRLP